MRFQIIKTAVEEGVEYVYLFDSKTGQTIKSPVNGVPVAPVPTPVRVAQQELEPVVVAANHERPAARKVPSVFSGLSEVEAETISAAPSAAIVPVETKAPVYKNPHATARPQYAWQDPDWIDPATRRKRGILPPPPGMDFIKVFRDPGKVGEGKEDITTR